MNVLNFTDLVCINIRTTSPWVFNIRLFCIQDHQHRLKGIVKSLFEDIQLDTSNRIQDFFNPRINDNIIIYLINLIHIVEL